MSPYSVNPQFQDIKNDIVIWGEKQVGESKTPIRYHLIIDKKPIPGNKYDVFFYTDTFGVERGIIPVKAETRADFPLVGVDELRYLDKSTAAIYKWDTTTRSYLQEKGTLTTITTKEWMYELYFSILAARALGLDQPAFAAEIIQEYPIIYDLKNQVMRDEFIKYPTKLNYFFDIIDTNDKLFSYSISNAGKRSLVLTEQNINCIFTANIPDLVILNLGDPDLEQKRLESEVKGQDYIQVPQELYSFITLGGRRLSAFEEMKNILHRSIHYNETISVDIVPMMHLEANTRITFEDEDSGFFGDYMITGISTTLDSRSNMSLNLIKIIEKY